MIKKLLTLLLSCSLVGNIFAYGDGLSEEAASTWRIQEDVHEDTNDVISESQKEIITATEEFVTESDLGEVADEYIIRTAISREAEESDSGDFDVFTAEEDTDKK